MLLLEDRRYYTYIYLDPRKPGKYCYEGLDRSFLYEPFYVGLGKNNRMYDHLNLACKNSIKCKNSYRLNKIRKILSLNLSPIISKTKEYLTFKESQTIEKLFIMSIGRKDLHTGCLLNLTAGGDGAPQLSDKTKKQIVEKTKQTLQNNPDIQKYAIIKMKATRNSWSETKKEQVTFTLKNRRSTHTDEQKELTRIKHLNTLNANDREIIKKRTEKLKNTWKSNPDIVKNKSEKHKETYKNNPQIKINANVKFQETIRLRRELKLKNNPISIKEPKKIGGTNNSSYIKLDSRFILTLYFSGIKFSSIINDYNKKFTTTIGKSSTSRFFNVLDLYYRRDNKKRLECIANNKDKLEWYIDNYERLEEEYFKKIKDEKNKIK